MTLTKRIVACLDVLGTRVVKGRRFVDLRDVGEPVELAVRYEADGADEIVFLDISATPDDRTTMLDVVRQTAERLFIPLTVGGGIRSVDDVARALRAGADKVSINSAAIDDPALLTEGARRFGAQCIVASIDAKMIDADKWEVYAAGGRRATGLDAIDWAQRAASLGAGEILLTSIDRDGVRTGYDLDLLRAISAAVDVPVVASGGAGSAADVARGLIDGNADAALIAGILHDGVTSIAEIKRAVAAMNVAVRSVTNVRNAA